MGLFLIFLSIGLLATTVLIFIGVANADKAYVNRYTERKVKSKFWLFWYNRQSGTLQCASIIILVICVFALLVSSVYASYVGIKRNIEYEKMEYQYTMLSDKLESDSGNYYLLYNDINKYNNTVLEDRYWSNNIWVNWYHNGKIKDLPLIGEPSEKTPTVPQQFSNFEKPPTFSHDSLTIRKFLTVESTMIVGSPPTVRLQFSRLGKNHTDIEALEEYKEAESVYNSMEQHKAYISPFYQVEDCGGRK